MIQIDRIEHVMLGQGERLIERKTYETWDQAFAALRGSLSHLGFGPDHETEIRSAPDTQIGPVAEMVQGVGAAYSAHVLYDVRVV